MFTAQVSYPDFYASVVRAIVLGIEHARMPSVTLWDLLQNSIGYTVMSPVCMPASFVLFQDWINWREGKTRKSETLLDGFIAYFIAFLNVGKFHVYYVVFYGYGRTIGDLQQFVMSPLFERDSSRLVNEQQDPQSTLLTKSTQDYSLCEKLIYSEATMNCFMPDGPSCLLGTLKSSEVWRTFDRGLYIVLKQ
ncbi:unnamed protein product [Schistocephalus solidus]|uniref:ABC2_membrane domain-containing protein n=1 Tax=Schistocephalus solidus TaxID=70667 RepID=A0A183SGW4_SCHSO|nr:unnamed protein product [Schistocephalus solidus]